MPLSLVTGGAGFIGSHVVDALISSGHRVRVLDCSTAPHRPDVEFSDVNLVDLQGVLKASEGADYVFHLGAVANVNQAVSYPVLCGNVNVMGTINILEAARKHQVKRMVFASSVWVYSGSPKALPKESDPFYIPKAGPMYSPSKIAGELFAHEYWNIFQQPFTILRYGTPFGPRMRPPLVVHTFIVNALKGRPIVISGDGSQYRNFIYVEDLAEAHPLVLGERALNQTYNLEGQKRISIREVAESIACAVGGDVEVRYLPERPGDDKGIGVDISKARRELGWEPRTSFDEGIQRTVKWYRHNYSG